METTSLSIIDSEWGYTFGCDGVMRQPNAEKFLDCSHDTLERMVAKRMIRKGKDPRNNRPVYCKRSIDDYMKSIEQIAPEDCRSSS